MTQCPRDPNGFGSYAGMVRFTEDGQPELRELPRPQVASLADWRGKGFSGLPVWTNRPPESSQCALDADFPSSISLQTDGLQLPG